MCGTNSADAQIQASVRQVAQLASMVELGDPLETYLLIPSLIVSCAAHIQVSELQSTHYPRFQAGAASRKEKHRAILYRKVHVCQGFNASLLSGADLVRVLEHLWHGAASEGRAITWEDYITSRYAALPIDV
jgi:hypothetical protein